MAFDFAGLASTIGSVLDVAAKGAQTYAAIKQTIDAPGAQATPATTYIYGGQLPQASQGFVGPNVLPISNGGGGLVRQPVNGGVIMADNPFVPRVSMPEAGNYPLATTVASRMTQFLGPAVGAYVEVKNRAQQRYQRWLGTQPGLDVLQPETSDAERVVAKIIASKGAVPVASDIGQLALASGAKPYKVRVRYTDGSSELVDVVKFRTSRTRAKRKTLTSYRIGTAAWVMRKLHAQQRLGRRLVAAAHKLQPARRSSSKAKRRR